MKKTFLIIAAAVCVAFSGILLHGSMKNSDSSAIFDSMVEALTDGEQPTINNMHMKLLWVTEYFGGEAIICTYGGDDCCE